MNPPPQVVEAASPISTRPPSTVEFSSSGSAFPADEDEGGGGNRWAREETLALLRIRSEMDATFRDATLKGPLWEHVSSKLDELGYRRRSAKKCKEKFENVHKYYKRTKEARQAGKSYKFFSQLDALHSATTTVSPRPPATTTHIFLSPSAPPPINPTPISSIRFAPTSQQIQPHPMFSPNAAANPDATSFSTNSASTDDQEDLSSRKRKRGSETGRMMEFFEGLMKQVMQKQDAMQQRFLEAMDKREQDRVMREEAWKQQEMSRLSRENELLAQDRAVSASRDAAIISFLQKITGQTIQLPSHLNINPPQSPAPVQSAPQPQQQQQRHRPKPPSPPPPQQVQDHHQAPPVSTNEVMVVPEQAIRPQEMSGGGGSSEPSSSRWPKAEILALIDLRSGLDSRYQEAGPKGPLWEEISAGMQRMGYKRSAKRCKEKWENINKYFKKVKESNKKRPEDAKTCPYFHQLDALYSKKILTSSTQNALEQQQPVQAFKLAASTTVATHTAEPQNKNGGGTDASEAMAVNLFGGPEKKPEDIVKEIMAQQLMTDHDYDKMDSYNIQDDQERKMDYKMEFQRQNSTTAPNSNGAGNGAPSFLAMVQ